MSIYTQLRTVERKFFFIIIGLVVLSVLGLGGLMYEANILRFDKDATSQDLEALVEDQPEVAAYLEQEKNFEAHFITITNLVKQDQQQELGNILIIATLGTIVVAAGAGLFASRYLLKPVRESYISQERFLQDAAHELRNPLAAMSAALQNDQGTKKSHEDMIVTMRRQTNRLIRINEDLLYLERRRPGRNIMSVNVSNLLGDILEDLQPVVAGKKLEIETLIEPKLEKEMDPADFIKLARNTIENAVKYSKKGKSITVRLESYKSGIRFTVADEGIGIPESDLPHIGERFYRATNAQKHDGTGLGIAIVNKVLFTYGGSMDIASQPNIGTTVTITF